VDESATGSVNFLWGKPCFPHLPPSSSRAHPVPRLASRRAEPASGHGYLALTERQKAWVNGQDRRARILAIHLRMPSIDQGVQSFVWAVVFFLYMWLGALALDFPSGASFVIALVLAAAIFLLVRTRGGTSSPSRG
jgi:hypothetical protein